MKEKLLAISHPGDSPDTVQFKQINGKVNIMPTFGSLIPNNVPSSPNFLFVTVELQMKKILLE